MKETMIDILDNWLDSRMKNIHTCLPGKIETYNSTTRKATVKIQIKPRMINDDTTLSIPPIPDVPVVFPSCAKFTLEFPLEKGDGCLILFSEEGIGSYLNGNTEVDADSFAKFSLTDAICIPGLFSFKEVPESTATIVVDKNGNINMNGDSENLVTYDALNTALQSMLTSINATFATKLDGGGTIGATTLDISASKADTLRTDG
jgi:hypothetical protein